MKKNQNEYDVFLSYASKDGNYARKLASALKQNGLKTWYDEGQFRAGDTILRQIENALEHSRYFVFVVSPSSQNSQWMPFEMGVALSRLKKSHLLPIFLHSSPSEIKQFLPVLADKTAIYADKYSIEEIAKMVSDLVKNNESSKADKNKAAMPSESYA